MSAPNCGEEAKEPYVFSGKGTVFSYTVLQEGPAGFENTAPYTVALVQLVEGPLVTAQLTDLGDEPVTIGMPVEMVTRRIRSDGDDSGILIYGYKFRPAGLVTPTNREKRRAITNPRSIYSSSGFISIAIGNDSARLVNFHRHAVFLIPLFWRWFVRGTASSRTLYQKREQGLEKLIDSWKVKRFWIKRTTNPIQPFSMLWMPGVMDCG